jgi:hypothetical protein
VFKKLKVKYNVKNKIRAWHQRLSPVILAIQEAKIRRITI